MMLVVKVSHKQFLFVHIHFCVAFGEWKLKASLLVSVFNGKRKKLLSSLKLDIIISENIGRRNIMNSSTPFGSHSDNI